MPLYYFKCSKCHREQRRILTVEESRQLQSCGLPTLIEGETCGYVLQRTPRAPTAQVMETLDNGVMTKRLERLADAERLFEERDQNKKKGKDSL